jgi:hypothetical protein
MESFTPLNIQQRFNSHYSTYAQPKKSILMYIRKQIQNKKTISEGEITGTTFPEGFPIEERSHITL